MEKSLSHMVSVYGNGLGKPILQTNDARLVQIRNGNGRLVAIVTRMSDAVWGISSVGDPDWEAQKMALEIDDSKA